MTIKVQNENGTIEGANSYVDVAAVRAFWLDRGVDLSAKTDEELSVAAVRATDYLDAKYRWTGYQLYRLQGTQWPRSGVTSFLRGLPPALVSAACMLAQRALTKPLMPDPTFDASGQRIAEKLTEVGPIKTQVKFSDPTGVKSMTPEYPEVTLMLQAAGLVASGNSGEIGRG